MNKDLKVSKSITINASTEQIWDVLTNPEKIKVYLFGTETITDWKIGSPILFQGEYQGQQYQDKGNVIENQTEKILKYNYWSGFSGLTDEPENYSMVTYSLDVVEDNQVTFTWTQEGFASESGQQHLENGLPALLEQIKKLAES